MIVIDQPWICYTVRRCFNDEWPIIYVGICPVGSIATIPDANANGTFRELVTSPSDIRVTYNGIVPSEADAQLLRDIQFATMPEKPWCNLNVKPYKASKRGRGRMVRDIMTGQVFESAAATGRAFGVSTSAICQQIRGMLKSVADTEFEWVEQ